MMYRCPKCESDNLEVVVTVWAKLIQNGPGEFETDADACQDGSHEFDGGSSMICRSCQHSAASKTFEGQDFCQCGGEVDGKECQGVVTRSNDYYATPCGTFCDTCMQTHALGCEICSDEFGLPHKDDQEEVKPEEVPSQLRQAVEAEAAHIKAKEI